MLYIFVSLGVFLITTLTIFSILINKIIVFLDVPSIRQAVCSFVLTLNTHSLKNDTQGYTP